MTARRKGTTAVEVTEPTVEEQQPEETSEVTEPTGHPEMPEGMADFVKDLVALFVDQQLADIKQELADLRTMLMQPKGAVEFTQGTVYSDDFPHSGDREVPWYTADTP